MSTRFTSILKDPNVAKHLSLLHDKYVIVSADKAPNNIVFVCKSHYIDCLIKELGIDNSLGNPTYTPTTLTKEEILDNHRSVLCSFGISTKDEELDLPSLYWIPKLHKCPFKQRYIAGSAKCSTKPLSKLLTCILSTVKTRLQIYCDTSYSRGGVNQMWILKNSKDLLEYIRYWSLSSCNSINTVDFSTLYTTIPLSKLEDTCSVVDCRFESHRVQTKDYDVGIYFLSIKNAALRIRSKDYMADNQYNVSELSDWSTRWLLFQWASTIKVQLNVFV